MPNAVSSPAVRPTEGVGGKAEYNLPDQIHPNVEGHRIVAGNVWKVLEPLLR